LANPSLVSNINEVCTGSANTLTSFSRLGSVVSRQLDSPTVGVVTFDRMAYLKMNLLNEGFSHVSSNIIGVSWRKRTSKQYQSCMEIVDFLVSNSEYYTFAS